MRAVTGPGGYAIGALLAVAAGAVFNLGVLIQKKAVNAAGPGDRLMARLVRDKLWLGGLVVQFLLGTPMYAAAQLFIGPTLIPGLMATGLVVLALGSPALVGERLRPIDFVGVALIVVAVALFGLSRLSVDLGALDLAERPLRSRLLVMTAAATALALLLFLGARLRLAWRGILAILAAGLLYALGNLWLGVVMTALARIVAGGRAAVLFWAGGVSLAVVGITNLLSIVWTQEAFRHGKAASLVPVQQVPVQILPALCYFLVFLQRPPTPASPYLAASGVLLILAGSALLGGKGGGDGQQRGAATP